MADYVQYRIKLLQRGIPRVRDGKATIKETGWTIVKYDGKPEGFEPQDSIVDWRNVGTIEKEITDVQFTDDLVPALRESGGNVIQATTA